MAYGALHGPRVGKHWFPAALVLQVLGGVAASVAAVVAYEANEGVMTRVRGL